jgi:hypothetical protein
MMITKPIQPSPICPICGRTLSLVCADAGADCADPAHWLAAGRVATNDYYTLAQLIALGRQKRGSMTGPGSVHSIPG